VILLQKDPNEPLTFRSDLPSGWAVGRPEKSDVPELTALLRRHEEHARGWATSSADDVLVELSEAGATVRRNLTLCDRSGTVRGWATAHDRAAGRMLLGVVVDWRLDDSLADRAAEVLFEWADEVASKVGAERGLDVQQIDAGAFADDKRQQRWLAKAGFRCARTWWQMKRPAAPGDEKVPALREGVRIRRVEREGSGMPEENDLRVVHDILEAAFADHFNSHEETFDEFLFRLRQDPGHRWDHWWLAELLDGAEPQPVGTLVGTVTDGGTDASGAELPASSYVAYIGVLEAARGRGVAKGLLNTIIADAAERGFSGVGLEVDAHSPTGANNLYLSMGWETSYSTQSWHRDVAVED